MQEARGLVGSSWMLFAIACATIIQGLSAPDNALGAVAIPDGDVAGLNAAIVAANTSGVPDTIELAAGGTYTLTEVNNSDSGGPSGLAIITSDIEIHGNGATIQRSPNASEDFRIFRVQSASGRLTLDGVTVRGGSGTGGAGFLVRQQATLSIFNSTVADNHGTDGGGILNFGNLTIANSTLSGNESFGGFGGGAVLNFSGVGGVATTAIFNSTIFENQADSSAGSQGRGDALADAFSPDGSVVLKNSIVASPTNGLGSDCFAVVIASQGHNIASDASCGLSGVGDLNSTDPQLALLANNGGPTYTHALMPASPAVNAVPLPVCTDLQGSAIAADQRGVTRPQGASCDIGSFELEFNDELIECTVSGSGSIVGTSSNDVICGSDGNDYIYGQGGDDILIGGGGADRMYGGSGKDQLFGGDGSDYLYGQDGSDDLFGEGGSDQLYGGGSNDDLDGGLNTDTCYGQSGIDTRESCESGSG